MTLLLIFRLVWGFIGGRYARFRSFVRGWRSVRAYGEGLLRLDPPHTVGHNPVGGWMIMLLLGTLSLIVLTGLLAEGKTGGSGPFSDLVSNGAIAIIGDIHAWLGFLIMWLAGLHVAGVMFESLLQRENLILTMITGRKRALEPNDNGPRGLSHRSAALLAIALVVLGAWFVVQTHMPPGPPIN